MNKIKRYNINQDCAWSEMVEAGDFVFMNFCVGNVGQSFEVQVNGIIDDMENHLKQIDLA